MDGEVCTPRELAERIAASVQFRLAARTYAALTARQPKFDHTSAVTGSLNTASRREHGTYWGKP